MRRSQLLAIALLALTLRAYPLHVFYIHPDQEWIPIMAMRSLVAGDWRPEMLVYPTGLMYTLRVCYTAAYAVGYLHRRFADRLDFLALFLERPFPFLLLARVWSIVLGVLGVVLVVRLGARLLGGRAGVLAGIFLAVTFLHVRESHYGSLDMPATTFFTAALLAALRWHETRALGSAALAGLLAGVTMAHRYQLVVVLLVLPAAELLRVERPGRGTAIRLGVAALAATFVFLMLSPDTLLDLTRTRADLQEQFEMSYRWPGPPSLPLHILLALAAGPAMCSFAAIGLLACLREHPRATLLLLVPLVPYLLSLLLANRVFARYVLPLLPLLAMFAAYGVFACARVVPDRHGRAAVSALALLTVAGPAARSLALNHLLAQEDTRLAARRWILDHVPEGAALIVNPATYGAPALPLTLEQRALRYGPSVAAQLSGRRLDVPRRPYRFVTPGSAGSVAARYAVTITHPSLEMFGSVPEQLAKILRQATPLAEFRSLAETDARAVQFDPTDANYTPLRGFDRVERPGPNITIWRIDEQPSDARSARPGRPWG